MLYKNPSPYFIVLASSVKTKEVEVIEFYKICVVSSSRGFLMWECYWHLVPGFPVSTAHRPDVSLMLHHRLRRWPSIEPTLGLCIVFARLFSRLSKACMDGAFTTSYGRRFHNQTILCVKLNFLTFVLGHF